MIPRLRFSGLTRLLILSLTIVLNGPDMAAQTISPRLFGQNAWMPDTIATTVLNGKLHANWSKVDESGATMVRFGGITADRELPTNYQYIKMIDSIRSKGMEPIIQVSYHDGDFTASQAAQLVQYINGTKSRNIKYWIIGNEPDLEYGYTTAGQVAAYIKPFASAMKAADTSIKIIGPETAWYNQTIINGLTTPGGPDDITGTDSSGRYYVDIISFHTYPFSGAQTRSQLIAKLTASPGFDTYLNTLSARVASCNAVHGRTGTYALKTAVTEMNVGYQNSSTDNVNGTGVNSFIGGQFVAEMYGLGMKRGVDIMTMWSVIEGNSTALNIGYLDRTTGNKKPVFHHFKMMADHFSGNYVSSTSTHSVVKVFSSQNSSLTTVMILNEDSVNSYGYAVRLNTTAITATNALKINVNAGIAQMYYNTIPHQSSVLLQFNAQGAIVKKVTYTIAQAIANLSPTVSVYSSSVIPTVAQPVNITPSLSLRVCSGSTTTLIATSSTNTIKWYGSGTSTAVLGTGTVFITPALSSNVSGSQVAYYAEAANTSTVTARTAITITIHARPVISVNSGAICQGEVFTLTPSGAYTYSFSSGQATVSPAFTSSYTVSGTSTAGCVSAWPAVASVSVKAGPLVSVNSGSICTGASFTIVPSGASAYTISGAANVVSPTITTVYTVTGVSSQGCSASAISTVSVQSLPIVSVGSGIICKGYNYTLTPSGAAGYSYSSGSPIVTPVSTTSYTIWGMTNGCMGYPVVSTVTVLAKKLCNTGLTGSAVATPLYASGEPTIAPIPAALPVLSPDSLTEQQQLTNGIHERIGILDLHVYPNPVTGIVAIRVSQESSLSIISLSGEVLLRQRLQPGITQLSMSDLPSGIYLARVDNGGEAQVVRIVKE